MLTRAKINSFLYLLFGFEKSKSRKKTALIVLVHIGGWCLFFFLPLLLYPVRINDNSILARELLDKLILVLFFYFNYYFLIPRFFERKKRVAYFAIAALCCCIYLVQHVAIRTNYFTSPGPGMGVISARGGGGFAVRFRDGRVMKTFAMNDDSVRSIAATPSGVPPPPMFDAEFMWLGIPKGIWLISLNNAVSSFTVLLLMGGFIRLAYSFIRNQNEKKALENAKLNAEVNFLKSQINPHFLFNTLNTIYSQAHSKSAYTEYSILRLSELLRYVLYDSHEEKVLLENDIQYINNYIDLQRLRLSSRIALNYHVSGDVNGYMIAPLLLITFIENAFKHGISYTQPSTITIAISVFEKTLTLTVSNPVTEKDSFTPGGIGLRNVRRRLDLLYGGRHQLVIEQDASTHIVNLKILLDRA